MARARSPSFSEQIDKFDIKLKTNPKDGVILHLHHTVRCSNGDRKRIRFSAACFDDQHEKIACADNGGNVFVLDFSDLKFWKLSAVGPCSAVHFVPNKPDTLVTANCKDFKVSFLNIETGHVHLTLNGHSTIVKHISFSCHKVCTMLTASAAEAIIWELTNYTKFFTLNTFLGAQIQSIMFTPAGDYLVACFQNDTVQIWKHESMKSVKQIIPSELKHMKSLAFTMNGRALAMAGLTPTLILFSMDTWKALKSIDLNKHNITGAQQIAFIPQLFDGGANKILAILSNDCVLHILDLEEVKVLHRIAPESSGVKKFVVSPTGKYFLCILHLGEVNIYNSTFVFTGVRNQIKETPKEESVPSTSQRCLSPVQKSLSKSNIEQKMQTCMDSARLRRILMQYGEYPEKFRPVIWRALLNTPNNKTAYSALVEKGIHPSYKDIEKIFTIHSTESLKSLKRLLSTLAHWCPLFAVVKFLPGFVFPFVKVLQKNPLFLFECVATILINHCQLWFEYAPFPPISVLGIIENVLAQHDKQLLDHYCNIGVTSQIYALAILETAFSEVLNCSEWLILWDHITSNEPSFILMAVVSYNIVQRNALKRMKCSEDVENFFHLQNPLEKKAFLKRTYILLNETADDIHPRKFINSYTSLDKGECYQQFTGYPKATICMKLAKQENNDRKKQYTLKELTTRSQEKIINDRIKQELIDYSADDSDVDNDRTPKKDDQSHWHNKEDCKKVETKEKSSKRDRKHSAKSSARSSRKQKHRVKRDPSNLSKCKESQCSE